MKKKLVGILFCMLLVVPVLSVTVVADDEPELEIEIIWDKKSLTAFIRNVGDEDAYDVEWRVNITGGILGRINISTEGNVDILLPGGEIVADIPFIIGFGPLEIAAAASASNADMISETKNGFILLFFVILR